MILSDPSDNIHRDPECVMFGLVRIDFKFSNSHFAKRLAFPARGDAGRYIPLLVAFAFVYALIGFGESLSAAKPDDPPAPGSAEAQDVEKGHKEAPDDAPAPDTRDAPQTGPRAVITQGPFVSRQVNIDANGDNILSDAANEPSIAVDPNDRNRIAVGWRQFDNIASNFRKAGRAYSTDGGQTWTSPLPLTNNVFRSDPVLGSDPAGNFYYYSLMSDFSCQMFRSFDGGISWGAPIEAFGGDKAWMTIDKTNGIGSGNIYIQWSWVAGCCGLNVFTRSTNGGLTYSTPITINGTPIWGTLDVGPDGTLYICGRAFNDNAPVYRSLNAQDPAASTTIQFTANVNMGGSTSSSTGPNPGGLLGQMWIATDHSPGPNNGAVYMLGSVDPDGPDPLDVMFAASFDGGFNWTAPIRVNDDAQQTGSYQWFGTMSVAPTGRIDAIWLDTRANPGGNMSVLYYSQSFDAGMTWSANMALTPPFNHTVGYPSQNKMGDYLHMVSDATGADLAYCATFTGGQDVYHIRIPGNDCNANGVADEQDIVAGTSDDCDGDLQPNECEPDCNTNGLPDPCETLAGTAIDCNDNLIPDECEIDCNTNGVPDDCDILGGTSFDCDANMVPDVCDPDCNTNGLPDTCDLSSAMSNDLNGNDLPDECEDCNGNDYPDDLDLSAGTSPDCNSNALPDECDVAGPTSNDCDVNGVPDECEPDCNGNSVADTCDLTGGTSVDCFGAGVPDECRLDCDNDGTPDDCEIVAGLKADCDQDLLADQCEPTRQGYALQFDGIDDHVDVGAGFNFASGFTIEAWIRTTNPLTKQVIFSKRQASPLAGYALFVEDAKLVFTVLGEQRYETVQPVIAADQWTHVAVTFDDAFTARFFVNGDWINKVNGKAQVLTSAGDVFIGALPPTVDEVWTGLLDEVRIWSRVRTGAEIVAAMNTEISAGDPDLAGYWRFNTGSGLVAMDETGAADGDLIGGPTWQDLAPDCNSNGAIDVCDITFGTSTDIDLDESPDDCQPDCNSNAIPDGLDLSAGASADCNANFVPDECDINGATSDDCTGDDVPDECEPDCNSNGVADSCDVLGGTTTDCDADHRLDICEMNQSNYSLRLDGIDDYADAGNIFNDLANGFTIEAWVRLDSIAGKQLIFSKRRPSPLSGFVLFNLDGKLRFTTLGVQSYTTSAIVLSSQTWTHVALVFDASNDATFYINGAFVETISGSQPAVTGNGRVHLGRTSPDGADYLAGEIDDVRIWRIERDPAAIAATMFARLTGDEQGLAAWWPMDEGSGSISGDASPNGLNLTLFGATWTDGYPVDTDCNTNSAFDACDVVAMISTDCNANEVLDACESPIPGDFNADNTIDANDAAGWSYCETGPGQSPQPPCDAACLAAFDFDNDNDIDLTDWATFQQAASP